MQKIGNGTLLGELCVGTQMNTDEHGWDTDALGCTRMHSDGTRMFFIFI